MTATLWQRPTFNQARARYHATNHGTPLCGAKCTTGLSRPRELTQRQIETQACTKCITKINERGDK